MREKPSPTTKDIRKMLERLEPGQGTWLKLPGDQPYNRGAYLRINGVAYGLWGAGGYRLLTGAKEIGVIRKNLDRQPAGSRP